MLPVSPAPTSTPPSPLSPSDLWSRVTELASNSRRLRTIIDSVAPASFSDGTLTLAAHPDMLSFAHGCTKDLEELASKSAGRSVRVVIHASESQATARGTVDPALITPKPHAALTDVRQHPLVKQAEELFGARVVRVEPRPLGS